MEYMRLIYMANDAAKSMRRIMSVLFGSISPENGTLSELDTQIHYMTAMHLAGIKKGEWYESDKTLGAAAAILSVDTGDIHKDIEEMEKIVNDYLKSDSEEN